MNNLGRDITFHVYDMCKMNVLRFDRDAISNITDINDTGPPITVVVLADTAVGHAPTIASIGNITYANYTTLFVCGNSMTAIAANRLAAHKHLLNFSGTFVSDHALNGTEMIAASLQNIDTEYVCFLFLGDMLHPHAISRAMTELVANDKDGVSSLSVVVGPTNWCKLANDCRPDNALAVFRVSAILPTIARNTMCECPRELLWRIERDICTRMLYLNESLHFHKGYESDRYYNKRYSNLMRAHGGLHE